MFRFFWAFHTCLRHFCIPPQITYLMSIPLPAFPRLEHNGTATGVDAICTYHPNISNKGLDRERVYMELKRLIVMKLGPYILDQNSLYVNGELYLRVTVFSSHTLTFPIPPNFLSFFIIYVGYTQQILVTTHIREYLESSLFFTKPMRLSLYFMPATLMGGTRKVSLLYVSSGIRSAVKTLGCFFFFFEVPG